MGQSLFVVPAVGSEDRVRTADLRAAVDPAGAFLEDNAHLAPYVYEFERECARFPGGHGTHEWSSAPG